LIGGQHDDTQNANPTESLWADRPRRTNECAPSTDSSAAPTTSEANQMTEVDRTDVKTAEEASGDVHYNIILWKLHRRLYNRISLSFGLVELGLGAAAIQSVLGPQSSLTGWIGLTLGAITILNNTWNPARKSADAHLALKRYAALRAECPALAREAIESRMALLVPEDPDEIESLKSVAYNKLVESQSRFSYRRRLSIGEWALKAVT